MPKKRVHKQQLEIPSKIHGKPRVQKKHPRKKIKTPGKLLPKGWMVCGFDTSMSSLAGAAIAWDGTLNKFKGPVFAEKRWSKLDHYYDRLLDAAKAFELVQKLQHQMLLSLEPVDIYIAQEEPWPYGLSKGGTSEWLKQQAEISGAFLGGLIRYGYVNVAQRNSMTWRKLLADAISEETGEDVTTHYSKWRSEKLAQQYNCTPKDSGKFRSKQWALDIIAPYFGQQYAEPNEIPDWPDIIESTKLGKIPRPEDSKAKAVQPDDRYDALAIMWAEAAELKSSGLLDKY